MDKKGFNDIITGLAVVLAVLSLILALRTKAELAAVQQFSAEDELRVQLSQTEAEIESLQEEQSRLEQMLEEKNRESVCRDGNVRSIAHRGLSAEAPENTLPAFRLAKEQGFSSVETDIRFTKDGVPVCLHDGSIDRTSNGSGEVADMTLEELRQYDFGAWKGEDFAAVDPYVTRVTSDSLSFGQYLYEKEMNR